MKTDLKALAEERGLLSVSLDYIPESGRYSANVQWPRYGGRECQFGYGSTPDEALADDGRAGVGSHRHPADLAHLLRSAMEKTAASVTIHVEVFDEQAMWDHAIGIYSK